MAKQSLALGLQACLGRHWMLKDDYSDFTVVVEDAEFPCHRFILASCSTFFRLLLGNDMREKSENRAVLKSIKKETFCVIANALYKGEDGLNSDNIVDVWYASHMLDISYLIQECENFALSILNTENYIHFYHHAKTLCSKSVTSSIFKFILQNFEHFKSSQAFVYMSFEEIRDLVEDSDLKVSSEDVVIDVILQWIKVEGHSEILEEIIDDFCLNSATIVQNENIPEIKNLYELQKSKNESSIKSFTLDKTEQLRKTRQEKLSTLLSSARLCLVSIDYLENLLVEPLIVSNPEAVKLVKKALMYHWKPELSINSLVKFRKCHETFNAMVFVKGSKLTFYSFEEKKEVATFEMYTNYTQMSAYKDKLVLCYNETSVSPYYQYNQYNYYKYDHYFFFNVVSRNRNLFAKIQDNPGSFFLCSQGFIILFSSNESSEKLIQLQNSNTSYGIRSIRTEHKTKFACIHRGLIFSFSDKSPNTRIQIYKLESNIWVDEMEISGPADNVVSFQCDENTYILQRNGDLWVIETVGTHGYEIRKLASLWKVQWCLRGAACLSNELFLFGENVDGVDSVIIPQTSLSGVFDRIEVVNQRTSTQVVPVIVPRNIQQIST